MKERVLIPRIGFEIHIQVNSSRKAFSPEGYCFDAQPNTCVSPVSLGYPGTLPVPNYALIVSGIKLGIALGCKINERVVFHRKNYFYPDLPKGYQISQHAEPLCFDGRVKIKEKWVRIREVHIEEDTGRSIHDRHPHYSLIDFNRAGVGLIELVTEPDISSPEEAVEFVRYIRRLVRYLHISDGDMEKGNLRCDTNVSLFDPHSDISYEKVEIKNLNSINHVQNALQYEIMRQKKLILEGEVPRRETRGFNMEKGVTFPMRTKELAHDYRYFPEPDIPPIPIPSDLLQKIKEEMPILPEEKLKMYIEKGIREEDARVLVDDPDISEYFDAILEHTSHTEMATYFMMGPIRNYLIENNLSVNSFPVPPEKIAKLVNLVEEGVVAKFVASQDIFEALIKNPEGDPLEIARQSGKTIGAVSSREIEKMIDEIIASHPDKVLEYKKGKKGIIGMIMGELNRKARGRFDPRLASRMVQEKLEKASILPQLNQHNAP